MISICPGFLKVFQDFSSEFSWFLSLISLHQNFFLFLKKHVRFTNRPDIKKPPKLCSMMETSEIWQNVRMLSFIT